jgi:hypothetical protein
LTPAFTSTGKWFSAGGIGHEYLLPSSKSAFPSTKLFIFLNTYYVYTTNRFKLASSPGKILTNSILTSPMTGIVGMLLWVTSISPAMKNFK